MSEYRAAGEVMKSGDYVIYRPHIKMYVIEGEAVGISEKQVFYPSAEILWQVSRNNEGQIELINFIGNLKINFNVGYGKLENALNRLAIACVNTSYAEAGRILMMPVLHSKKAFVLITLKNNIKVASGNGKKETPYEITFL